jgi:beta-glucosidase
LKPVECNNVNDKECWMGINNHHMLKENAISRSCNAASLCISYNPGTNISAAARVAAAADIVVIFVATNSYEGADRDSLSFDGNSEALVAAVAFANKNTVVVGVAPGAVLMPWRHSVAAALVSFMPGQEYGNAITDVLLGAVNPSGKLPLTLPTKENECPKFSADMWPGSGNALQANYSEHMLIGYRCYDHYGIEPAFPFGHGLSYTTFALRGLVVAARGSRISLSVTNTGSVDGQEVVQLYLTFPAAAGEPPQQLKRFEKVELKAGASRTVTFVLNLRDLSMWDTGTHAWTKVVGSFGVTVGTSSRDHKALKGSFLISV